MEKIKDVILVVEILTFASVMVPVIGTLFCLQLSVGLAKAAVISAKHIICDKEEQCQ